jgi:malonate transporter and related proteins
MIAALAHAFVPIFAGLLLAPQQRDYVVLLGAIPSGFFGIVFGKSFRNAVLEVASGSLIPTYFAGVFNMTGWMVVLSHLH